MIADDYTPVDGAGSHIEPFPRAPEKRTQISIALVLILCSTAIIAMALLFGR